MIFPYVFHLGYLRGLSLVSIQVIFLDSFFDTLVFLFIYYFIFRQIFGLHLSFIIGVLSNVVNFLFQISWRLTKEWAILFEAYGYLYNFNMISVGWLKYVSLRFRSLMHNLSWLFHFFIFLYKIVLIFISYNASFIKYF